MPEQTVQTQIKTVPSGAVWSGSTLSAKAVCQTYLHTYGSYNCIKLSFMDAKKSEKKNISFRPF